MKNYRVLVRLKPGVLDPQGKTVKHALHALGFEEAKDVRIGKVIELDLESAADMSPQSVQERIQAMCEKLLVNPVIEDYQISEG